MILPFVEPASVLRRGGGFFLFLAPQLAPDELPRPDFDWYELHADNAS